MSLTKKEKLALKRKRFFTGRADELTLFRSLLPQSRQTDVDILTIYGIGGIGKSVLLGEYYRICDSLEIPVALIDGQAHRSVFSLLLEIHSQLSATTQSQNKSPIDFPLFDKGLKRYRGIQDKLVSHTDIPQKLTKILMQTAKIVPVTGIIAEVVGEENFQRAMDGIYSTVGRIDGDFFLQPEAELTESLISDLNDYAENDCVVIMFDTYEAMTVLDDWVRDSFFPNLTDFVFLVIAGRQKLEGRDWSKYFPLIVQHELGGFSDREAREYLQKRNVANERISCEITAFAEGHPLTLALLVELDASVTISDLNRVTDPLIIVKELIERIVGKVEADLRTALNVCGIIRHITEESLAYMLKLDTDDASILFSKLRELDFVIIHNSGLSLHETIRTVLEEDLQWRAPESYRILHARAAEYYEKRISSIESKDKERYTLEHLYHCIRANEEEGTKLFQSIAEELSGYRLVSRLRAFLNEVNEYPLEQKNNKLWREYYNARLARLEMRLSDAEKIYQAIAENTQIDPKLRAYALCDWGELLSFYQKLSQPGGIEKAVSVLTESTQLELLDFHLAHSFVYLARIQQYLFRSDESANFYSKAKQFFQEQEDKSGLAYVLIDMKSEIGSRGLWRDLFDIQNELEDLLEHLPDTPALKWFKCTALWRWTWGEVLAGRFFDSEQKYEKSIALSRSLEDSFSLHSALRDLGWTLGHQGRYDEANKKFAESLAIVEQLGQDYIQDSGTNKGFWGAVLTRQGKFEQAADFLMQALRIKEGIKDQRGMLEQLVWLGLLNETQQEAVKAKDFYNRSLEMKFCRRRYFEVYALTGLVRVAFSSGDCSDARNLTEEAVAIAHQHEYNDHLASLNLTLGHIVWDSNLKPGEIDNNLIFESGLSYYKKALVYALRFNRFLLDEVLWGGNVATPLTPITAYCLEKGGEGKRMLTVLCDWWESGFNNIGEDRPDTISPISENIPLVEAEKIARKREPGNGLPQQMIVDRIKEILVKFNN